MDEFEKLFGNVPINEAKLEEVETTEIETEVEEIAEEATEKVDEESEDETSAETQSVQESDGKPEAPQSVPVAVMIRERERARQAEHELQALRAQVAQQTAAQTLPADPYDDPEGFRAQQLEIMRQEVRQELQAANFNRSVEAARSKYGQETLDQLSEWAGERAAVDPLFEQKAFAHPDPVEWVISERKRHEEFQQYQADPETFFRARAAELGLIGTNLPVENTTITETRKASTGPASIVHAHSRESTTNTSGKDGFSALFDK